LVPLTFYQSTPCYRSRREAVTQRRTTRRSKKHCWPWAYLHRPRPAENRQGCLHTVACVLVCGRVRLLGVGGSLKGSGLNIHVHAWMRQRGHLGAAPSHHISAFQHAQVWCLASRYQRCTENLNHFNLLKIHPTKKCKHACRRTRSADKQLCKRRKWWFHFYTTALNLPERQGRDFAGTKLYRP